MDIAMAEMIPNNGDRGTSQKRQRNNLSRVVLREISTTSPVMNRCVRRESHRTREPLLPRINLMLAPLTICQWMANKKRNIGLNRYLCYYAYEVPRVNLAPFSARWADDHLRGKRLL